jgi:hypothetical protein
MNSLGQMRSIFDHGKAGMVLIGMPGIHPWERFGCEPIPVQNLVSEIAKSGGETPTQSELNVGGVLESIAHKKARPIFLIQDGWKVRID